MYYLLNEKTPTKNLSYSTQAKDISVSMHQVFDLFILSVRYENSICKYHIRVSDLNITRNLRPMTSTFITTTTTTKHENYKTKLHYRYLRFKRRVNEGW